MDTALLIVRVVLGVLMIGHGTQKLFGWFGGPGLAGSAAFFKAGGIRPAGFWALVGGGTETFGGLLVVLGLLFPLGPLAIAAPMIIATLIHMPKGVWAQDGGYEYALTNLALAVALAISGAGRYALDRVFGFALPEPVTGIVVAILIVLGVAVVLGTKTRQPLAAPAVASTEGVSAA